MLVLQGIDVFILPVPNEIDAMIDPASRATRACQFVVEARGATLQLVMDEIKDAESLAREDELLWARRRVQVYFNELRVGVSKHDKNLSWKIESIEQKVMRLLQR